MRLDGSLRNINVVAASTRKNNTQGGLKKWFGQNQGTGWIDCKTGKPCGRSSASDSKRDYPACRPTKAQCKSASAKVAIRKKKSSKQVDWKKA